MPKPRKIKKLLSAKDFAGDGEPYTEAVVTISIRILGKGITRSRLAVNVYPDPALKQLATESLKGMKIAGCGFNQDGVFGACLSENFNGWEDLNEGYPKIDETSGNEHENASAKAMNSYIKTTVDWALELHKKGMAEALLNDAKFSNNEPVH